MPERRRSTPRPPRVKGFLDRVNEYVALQKKVDDGLPKLSGNDDPSKIEAHQAAMAVTDQDGASQRPSAAISSGPRSRS